MPTKSLVTKQQRLFGLDTETSDPLLKDQGPSWVFGQGEVLVTGIYDPATKIKQAYDGNGGSPVKKLLLSASSTIVGAKISYDLEWLCYEHGLEIRKTKCQLVDVAIAESLIDEYQPWSLDDLAQKYLRERKGHEVLADIAKGHGLKGDFRRHLKWLWENGYKQEIRDYVISDADQPVRIWEKQKKILEDQGLMPAFEMNMKMVRITSAMKQHGAPIDYPLWQTNCAIAREAYEPLKANFVEHYGEININSAKQMAPLYDEYKVPYKYKITVKGWQPDGGRKFIAAQDAFVGQEVYDQKAHLKSSFPAIRIVKKKVVLFVPKEYAERTNLQLIRMGYQTTCNPSLGKPFFEATKALYQVVADVVEYKQIADIMTKFLGPNFERFFVQDKDGVWRIHGTFDPVGARQTGSYRHQ